MKVRCIKDVIMVHVLNRAFTKGKVYEMDEYGESRNNFCNRHRIGPKNEIWFNEHFEVIGDTSSTKLDIVIKQIEKNIRVELEHAIENKLTFTENKDYYQGRVSAFLSVLNQLGRFVR